MDGQILHSDLRVSTMTQISQVSSIIDLEALYSHLEISDVVKYIEYADLPGRGKRAKPKKVIKPRKNACPEKPTKRKKYFYNQVTIHLFNEKLVNIKVFNNGGIQMTGLKTISQGPETVTILLQEIGRLKGEARSEIFPDDINPKILPEMTKMVMINSDFDMGFRIDREVLHRYIIEAGYYSSYEPVIYPGVNIKYYYNLGKQLTGICNCEGPCDGKGKDGGCKKVTIAVFNSGKIIITGGQSLEHIQTAHHFITDFIQTNREFIQERVIS